METTAVRIADSMIYEPHILSDPMLPFIFHTDERRSGIQFHPNWHTNLEVLFCLSGRGTVKVETVEYAFEAGEVFVINSNMLHSIYTDTAITYDCLILDRDFCSSNGVPTDNILFREKIRDPRLAEQFGAVKQAYAHEGICRAARLRAAVLELLILLRENYTVCEHTDMPDTRLKTERIKRAMVYIRCNMSRPLTLEEIAKEAGISKYYFTREFRHIAGQTLFEYINVVRCKEAKRLISEGMTVSAAAQVCGFDNLSYFTRTYKKCIGDLPAAGKSRGKMHASERKKQ